MKKHYAVSLTVFLMAMFIAVASSQVMAQLYVLNISVTEGGTTNPAPGAHFYAPDAVAKITAVPDPGWSFVRWTLTNSPDSTVNPIHVTMGVAAMFLEAEFENNYDVTIRALCLTEGAELGVELDMDGSPAGPAPQTFIDIEGAHTFTVPAVDGYGHPFTKWSTGETSTTITVNMAGRYTALYGKKSIPSLTEWGILVLLVMIVAGGVVVIRRRRMAMS